MYKAIKAALREYFKHSSQQEVQNLKIEENEKQKIGGDFGDELYSNKWIKQFPTCTSTFSLPGSTGTTECFIWGKATLTQDSARSG